MKMYMGFWCPDHESQGVNDIRVEWAYKWMDAMDLIERTGRGTKRVIQAGGNVGIFPVGLSQHFEEVVTFEPVPDIYKCLLKNIEPYENIKSFNHGLGEDKYSARVDWTQKGNSGGNLYGFRREGRRHAALEVQCHALGGSDGQETQSGGKEGCRRKRMSQGRRALLVIW